MSSQNNWKISLLGRVELRTPEGGLVALKSRKSVAMLAYVGSLPDLRASRERLAGLLWDATSTSQSRLNLRKSLSQLRQDAAGATTIPFPLVSDGEVIALDPAKVEVDTTCFLEVMASDFDPPAKLALLERLYRGDFLEDLSLRGTPEFDAWVQQERERFRQCAIAAFSVLMESGGARELQTTAAMRVLALDPLEERGHRTLMRLYARQGRPGAAMKQYQQLKVALQHELGTVPERETRELFEKIARQRHDKKLARIEQRAEDSTDGTALDADDRPALRNRRLRKAIIAAGAACVALSAAGSFAGLLPLDSLTFWSGEAAEKARTGVAVLPFANLSPGDEAALFAEGLSDEIINNLVRISDLQVTGRTSSFFFKDKQIAPEEIGAKLGVRYLVEGSSRLSGDRLRVAARLIDVESGAAIWSNKYDGSTGDIYAIQDAVAEAVASALRGHLVPARERSQFRSTPANYQIYLAAVSHLQSQEAERVKTARALFQRLRNLEPQNVLAHTGFVKATVFLARNNLADFNESRQESLAALEQALALEPASAETLLAKGMLYQFVFYNYGTEADGKIAEAALRQAIARQETPEALSAYGTYLVKAGRAPEAISYLERAAALNPLERRALIDLGQAFEAVGRIEDALAQYATVDELYPELAQPKTAAGRMLVRYGQFERAEPWLSAAVKSDHNLAQKIWLICLYVNAGMNAEAEDLIASLEGAPPGDVIAGIIRLQLQGRYADALEVLKSELKEHPDPMWATGALTNSTILHRNVEALRYLKDVAPDLLRPAPVFPKDRIDLPFMAAHIFKEKGNKDHADRLMRQVLAALPTSAYLIPDDHVWRAGAFAELGDMDQAMKELEQARARGWRTLVDPNAFMRIEDYPMFERLRHDRRFKALIADIERSNRVAGAHIRARKSR